MSDINEGAPWVGTELSVAEALLADVNMRSAIDLEASPFILSPESHPADGASMFQNLANLQWGIASRIVQGLSSVIYLDVLKPVLSAKEPFLIQLNYPIKAETTSQPSITVFPPKILSTAYDFSGTEVLRDFLRTLFTVDAVQFVMQGCLVDGLYSATDTVIKINDLAFVYQEGYSGILLLFETEKPSLYVGTMEALILRLFRASKTLAKLGLSGSDIFAVTWGGSYGARFWCVYRLDGITTNLYCLVNPCDGRILEAGEQEIPEVNIWQTLTQAMGIKFAAFDSKE